MSEWLCKPLAGDFSKQLRDCELPTADTNALPREVVRCDQCHLVQFRPAADLCRRCASPLPPPPQLDFGLPGNVIVIEKKAAGSSASSSNDSPVWESAWYPPPHIRRQLALGPRIKKRRVQMGLTQLEVAVRADLPRSYVSRIENSHLLPGPPIFQRIADALAVEVAELFAEHGNDGGNRDSEDVFWSSMIHYFAQLQPEQMSVVLSHVRKIAVAGLQREEMVCRS